MEGPSNRAAHDVALWKGVDGNTSVTVTVIPPTPGDGNTKQEAGTSEGGEGAVERGRDQPTRIYRRWPRSSHLSLGGRVAGWRGGGDFTTFSGRARA